MTWSYSRLTTFEECPYHFFLHYLRDEYENELFYASYGSYVHKLIEECLTGSLNKEEMCAKFLIGFQENVRGPRPSGEIVESYIKKGRNYTKLFEPFPYEQVAVEKKIDFHIGERNFVGIIDYIGKCNDGLVIVDNKSRELKNRSCRKKPTANDRTLDKMLRQLYLYSAAVEQEYGELPKFLCFNCFKSQEFVVEEFNDKAYKETIQWALDTIEKAVNTSIFIPQTDYFRCRWLCGVSDRCEFYRDDMDNRRNNRYT